MRAFIQHLVRCFPIAASGALLILGAFRIASWTTQPPFGEWSSADGILLFLALIAAWSNLDPRLPFQNALALTVVVAASSLTLETFLTIGHLGWPAGATGRVPWLAAVFWVIALFEARNFARWSLRAWQSTPNYGLWLLGVGGFLGGLLLTYFIGAMLPRQETTGLWLALPLRIVAAWLILFLCTPWLIPKKDVPPDLRFSLIVNWLALNVLLFGLAVLRNPNWLAWCLPAASALVAVGAWYWRPR